MTQEENERQNMIRVVVCRPGERAEVTEIEDNLRSMQTVVGGLIQEYFPFHSEDDPRYDDLALIVNDEGKLMRLPPSYLMKTDACRTQLQVRFLYATHLLKARLFCRCLTILQKK